MPIGGYSYQPQGAASGQQVNAGQAATISPQEAVRILSLRLPKRLPNAPVPHSLLAGGGGGGVGDLNAVIQRLMQAFGQSGGATGGPGAQTGRLDAPGLSPGADGGYAQVGGGYGTDAPSLPAPRITIGDDPTRRIPLGSDGGPTPRPASTDDIATYASQFRVGGERRPLF